MMIIQVGRWAIFLIYIEIDELCCRCCFVAIIIHASHISRKFNVMELPFKRKTTSITFSKWYFRFEVHYILYYSRIILIIKIIITNEKKKQTLMSFIRERIVYTRQVTHIIVNFAKQILDTHIKSKLIYLYTEKIFVFAWEFQRATQFYRFDSIIYRLIIINITETRNFLRYQCANATVAIFILQTRNASIKWRGCSYFPLSFTLTVVNHNIYSDGNVIPFIIPT